MVRSRGIARPGFVILVVVLGALALAAPAVAAPGDDLWTRRSPYSGNDAPVGVVTTPSGQFAAAFNIGFDADYLEASSIEGASFAGDGSSWQAAAFGVSDGVPDTAKALAAGPDGIMTAGTRRPSATQNYLLVHFDALGALAGSQTWDGPAHLGDIAEAVAVDGSGASYVSGWSWSKRTSSFDVVTIKYDPLGMKLWSAWFDGAGKDDRPVAVAVRSGSVYVAARSRRLGHSDDIALLKYSASSGKLLWTRFYDDSLHRNDWPADLVVTGSGVYIGGLGRQATGKPSDALLLRYTSAGVRKWVRYTGGTGRDAWVDLEAAPDGQIRLTGSTVRTATASDVMTASWRSDGTFAWRKTFSTIGDFDEKAVALAVDSTGASYVVFSQMTTDVDSRVIAYGADGGTLWTGNPFGYFASEDDVPVDIAVSASTAVFVCTSGTPTNGDDYVVVAYQK